MNFEKEVKDLKDKIEYNVSEFKSLMQQFETAIEKTKVFLNDLCEAGYTKISIGTRTDSIPDCKNFPFSASGSVFGFMPESNERKQTGWPPIWGIVEKHGIGGGCGNSHQHQAKLDELVDGVYHLKEGKWIKINE